MKKLLIVMGIIFAMAVPLTTFAATSDTTAAQAIRGFCGLNESRVTDCEMNQDCQENNLNCDMERNGHGSQEMRGNCGNCSEISE